MGAAISAWVAVERNRISAQGLSGEAEELHYDLARGAKDKEVDA